MLKKLLKLSTILTILSLTFVTVSCGDDDDDKDKKDYLDGIVNFGGAYVDGNNSLSFSNGNKVEVKLSDNSTYTLILNYEVTESSIASSTNTDTEFDIQLKLLSAQGTILNKSTVTSINTGSLTSNVPDILEEITDWEVNKTRDLMSVAMDDEKLLEMSASVSSDKKTIKVTMDSFITTSTTYTYNQ